MTFPRSSCFQKLWLWKKAKVNLSEKHLRRRARWLRRERKEKVLSALVKNIATGNCLFQLLWQISPLQILWQNDFYHKKTQKITIISTWLLSQDNFDHWITFITRWFSPSSSWSSSSSSSSSCVFRQLVSLKNKSCMDL